MSRSHPDTSSQLRAKYDSTRNTFFVYFKYLKPKISGKFITNEKYVSITVLRGFSLIFLRADGTTIRFVLSYGAGIPSVHLRLASDSLPRFVLCGTIPLKNEFQLN